MIDDLFSQNGLSLDRLRAFCLVAEAGGVTKAVGGDASKQPLLSRQIKELEVYFGVELLRRTGRSMTLTEPGKKLYRLGRNYFGALADFKRECVNLPVSLQIGSGDSLIHWLILPRLAGIRKSFPNTRFTLLNLPTEAIVQRLSSGDVELGILRSDAVGTRLKVIPLGRLEFSLFVKRSHGANRKLGDWNAILRKYPLVILEGSGSFRRELLRSAEEAGIALRIELECSSFPVMAKALRETGLAAILPKLAAQEFPPSDYEQIPLPWAQTLTRKLSLAWNPRVSQVREVIGSAGMSLGKLLTF